MAEFLALLLGGYYTGATNNFYSLRGTPPMGCGIGNTNNLGRRGLSKFSGYRPLRFEQLEERRLLAIIADTFADTFAQVTRITGQETTILTADAAGNSVIFYQPNDELGYVDPETGDLLFADYFPGTSTVFVIDAAPNGNVSDLAGVLYSNGQPIIANGGATVYHRDGSIMRSGGVWTYDAGATLTNGTNWFWSNGNQLLTGASAFHSNGAALRSGSSLFYAGGGTFQSGATLNYPTGQSLKDAVGDWNYETGATLRDGDVLRHPTGGVMVEADGTVRNENGDLSFAPCTRTNTLAASEVRTDVSYVDSQTIVSIANDVGGAFGSYVTRFDITYQALLPDPTDLKVTYIDDATLLFQWTSGGGSTAGYRVAWATGVSAPGDVSGGVDVADNYYVVTGLTPGQKVSLRVASKDAEGDHSYGATATGTAGALEQAPQTGAPIASTLDPTFAQVWIGNDFDKEIILTVDRHGNSHVWYRASAELGYINIDNGDRLIMTDDTVYRAPVTNMFVSEVDDGRVFGNVSRIPSGTRYLNGQLLRDGDTYYHENGSVLRSADGTWFYPSGNAMKNATTTFWPGSITMRSGTTFRYPNNAVLKAGSNISHDNGTLFFNGTIFDYRTGLDLRDSSGNMLYQTAAPLYSANTFRYSSGPTMIDASGVPHASHGTVMPYPFTTSEALAASSVYVGIDSDRIARYTIPVLSNTSVHVLGGTVDYSVVPPPKPLALEVASVTSDSIAFNLTSGGGTTQDFVYAYNLGGTAPYTPDGGAVASGNTFTITGLDPNEQIAVRLFARNSEGEFSPGITATATTGAATLQGDYNQDNTVDAADYVLWRKNPSQHGNAPGYTTWQTHFGESQPAGGGQSSFASTIGVSRRASTHPTAGIPSQADKTNTGASFVELAALRPSRVTSTPAAKSYAPTPLATRNAALLAWLSVLDREMLEASLEFPNLTGEDEDAAREVAYEALDQFSGDLLAVML